MANALATSGRAKAEEQLFHQIVAKLRVEKHHVWAVADLLTGTNGKVRKQATKPLHPSQKLVIGSTKSNGLPLWILQDALSQVFGVDGAEIKELSVKEVHFLTRFTCNVSPDRELHEMEQLPAVYVEWLVVMATAHMGSLLVKLAVQLKEFTLARKPLCTTTAFGVFVVVASTDDDDKLDAVLNQFTGFPRSSRRLSIAQ